LYWLQAILVDFLEPLMNCQFHLTFDRY